MRKIVTYLENSLACWETSCFVCSIMLRAAKALGIVAPYENIGPLFHAPEFRKYLLGAAARASFDFGKFWPTSDVMGNQLGAQSWVPIELFNWTKASRRVFDISPELQELLRMTSLNGITWKDALEVLPFPSFAIEFEQPLVSSGGTEFGGALFSTVDIKGSTNICFRIFPKKLLTYQPLREKEKSKMLHQLATKEWGRLNGKSTECRVAIKSLSFVVKSFPLASCLEREVPDSLIDLAILAPGAKESIEEAIAVLQNALNIVIGFCLYLKTLPSQSSCKKPWGHIPQSGKQDPLAICNEAQVCVVSSCYQLSDTERHELGENRIGSEKACHFRRGHWRKAPGCGSDPSAPKIIHVRPTLVRRDRLKENQLPGGSEAQA